MTAYKEFPVKGYELDVMDYLIKPVYFKRFNSPGIYSENEINIRNARGVSPEILVERYFGLETEGRSPEIFLLRK